jgi:hypothetical protein
MEMSEMPRNVIPFDTQAAFPFGLISLLKSAAHEALQDEKWILCATICRLLDELQLNQAVGAGARVAWDQYTRAVPLIGTTRDEKPREGTSGETRTCAACGGPGQEFVELVDVGTPGEPDATVQGRKRWAHLNGFGHQVGRDHPFTLES